MGKRIISFLLSLLIIISSVVTVFADNNYNTFPWSKNQDKITVKNLKKGWTLVSTHEKLILGLGNHEHRIGYGKLAYDKCIGFKMVGYGDNDEYTTVIEADELMLFLTEVSKAKSKDLDKFLVWYNEFTLDGEKTFKGEKKAINFVEKAGSSPEFYYDMVDWLDPNDTESKIKSAYNKYNKILDADEAPDDSDFSALKLNNINNKVIEALINLYETAYSAKVDDIYNKTSPKDVSYPKDKSRQRIARLIYYIHNGNKDENKTTNQQNQATQKASNEFKIYSEQECKDDFDKFYESLVWGMWVAHQGAQKQEHKDFYDSLNPLIEHWKSKLDKTDKRRFQILQALSVYNLPESSNKTKYDLTKHNFKYDDTFKDLMGSYTGASVSNADQKDIILSNIKTTTDDFDNWASRMQTYSLRLQYFAMCASDKDKNMDTDLYNYTMSMPSGYVVDPLVLKMMVRSTALFDGPFTIRNKEAFEAFIATYTELYTYASKVPKLIMPVDTNTLGKNSEYVKGILSIFQGLTLLDSEEAWELWNTKVGESEKTASLSETYLALQKVGAFDGLGDTSVFETARPFGTFMDLDNNKLSNLYLKGIAYSSTYIPMSTNVYDTYTLTGMDKTLLEDFHYKYGYHRKALYRDTSANAAVDYHNTGTHGTLKVCTLKDLLNADVDQVLYLDDNFYNAKSLAEIQDMAFTRMDNVDGKTDTNPWYKKLWNNLTDMFVVDIYETTKTAEKTKYSNQLRSKLTAKKSQFSTTSDNTDNYVMPSKQIIDVLDGVTTSTQSNGEKITTYDDYSVMFPYAVVSAIYRDNAAFKLANQEIITKTPVFVSSKDLCQVTNAKKEDKQTILNYALLKNLKANMQLGYENTLDMNSPLYMDIYGNILTESGYVVVPAACNASLWQSDEYYKNLYNAGLFSVYGDAYSIPTSIDGIDDIMEEAFEKDEELGVWNIKSRIISGTTTDYSRLSTSDRNVSESIQNQFEYNLSVGMYDFELYANICWEVLRGAPIEYIDKTFEGLDTGGRISRSGLLAASKLEELDDAFNGKGQNTLLSIPNLAFFNKLEYVVSIVYKFLITIVVVILMITIYTDAVGQNLSYKTLTKCLTSILLTVLVIVSVPEIFQITYYQTNKALLQKEAITITLLNTEKRKQGVEIGVTEAKEPESKTKLLVKLDDISMPWNSIFDDIMTTSTLDNISDAWDEWTADSSVAVEDGVIRYNDGIYMTVDDIIDSASVEVDMDTGKLYMRTNESLPYSFYSPYYVFLNALIENINTFNDENDWHPARYKTYRGGQLKSLGMIQPYLTSKEFMEDDNDFLYLTDIYNLPRSLEREVPFNDEDLKTMRKSAWAGLVTTTDQYQKRIDIVNEYAKEYVSKNKDLIGKMSDETFLQVMALDLAFKHNTTFGVQSADSVEIYNLSNDDLLRLSIAPSDTVLANSSLTFGRFVYTSGGTFGVIAAALLVLVNWVSALVKPICVLVIFLSIFMSIFVFRVILRKNDNNLLGYLITVGLLCGENVLYSIMLKLTMFIPKIGFSTPACALTIAGLNLIYLSLLMYVTKVSLRDWRDLGFERYMVKAQQIHVPSPLRLVKKENGKIHYRNRKRNVEDNWAIYNRMKEENTERMRRSARRARF